MKRLLVLLFVAVILMTLCACSSVEISGIENYRKQTCSVSLTEYLFPSDDFLTEFSYNNGGYEYRDTGDLAWGDVTTLCYLSYEDDVYKGAKESCLTNFAFCEEHQFTHNGYQFGEILCHKITDDDGNRIIACNYPKQFNMLAYNDEKCTLIFMGYYNGAPGDPEKTLAENDFSSFLKTVYTDYYNFDE